MPSDARKHLLLSYAALLGVGFINLSAPLLPVSGLTSAALGAVVVTLLYVGAVMFFALGIARAKLSILATLGFFAFCALCWVGVEQLVMPRVQGFMELAREVGAAPTSSQRFVRAAATTVQDLALISGATFAGALISRIIRYPNLLGPIGAAIALIDIWGVLFGGIVSQMLANKATQPLADKAMAAGPQIGGTGGGGVGGFSLAVPSIGVGDFLFIGLLLAVLVRLDMNWRTPVWLIWLLVSGALLSLMLPLGLPHLPGLLFIAAGAALPNLKYFSFEREEKFALLWAGLFVLILTIALYFGFKSALPS